MPVHGMNVGERPRNTANAEPSRYLRIFIDVTRIVVVNEVVLERLTKNYPCQDCETDADAHS